MKQDAVPMSEALPVGVLLAAVGGFLDAYTYLCRGKVFANAQTGNIVLLGLSLAGGDLTRATYYLFPILAFVLGVAASEIIRRRGRLLHWRQLVLAAEICVLLFVSFLPLGSGRDTLANILVSFVCAMQAQSFRKLRGYAYVTTMCTGNLRSGTESLLAHFRTRDWEPLVAGLRYFGIILSFVAGAWLGALSVGVFAGRAVLLACAGQLAVLLLMFQKPPEKA